MHSNGRRYAYITSRRSDRKPDGSGSALPFEQTALVTRQVAAALRLSVGNESWISSVIRSHADKHARPSDQLHDLSICHCRWDLPTFDPIGDGPELFALRFRYCLVHFEESQSGFHGLEIDVRIAEAGQKRQTEGFEKAFERFVGRHGIANLVGYDSETDVAHADAARKQQIPNEVGRGMDIDCRGRHRDHDAIRAGKHFLEQKAGSACRRVDNELSRVRWHVHLDPAQAVALWGCRIGGINPVPKRVAQT